MLKVPHQGAAGSCGDELLRRTRPRYAVISCGPNAYGHPAPATIRRLVSHGVMLHRTDLHGQVTYHSNGHGVRVETYGRR
ncbi:MAG: hypothetical protein HUU35_11420 [Armatimonadetes bacterium]|nr:hypothetical protein [Armatimonadota bacterium]